MERELASQRTNLTLCLDGATGKLIPVVEIIFLTLKPKYKIEGGVITKTIDVEETRICMGPESLRDYIATLKITEENLDSFGKIAERVKVAIQPIPEDKKWWEGTEESWPNYLRFISGNVNVVFKIKRIDILKAAAISSQDYTYQLEYCTIATEADYNEFLNAGK